MYLTIVEQSYARVRSAAGPAAYLAKHAPVLPVIAVVFVLCAAGVVLVGFTARVAMNKLGLELWDVLLWLGIAEAPVDELAARRGRPFPRVPVNA